MNRWDKVGKTWTYEAEPFRLTIRLNKDGWKGVMWVNGVKLEDVYQASPALTWGFVQGDFWNWAARRFPYCQAPRTMGNSAAPQGTCTTKASRKIGRVLLCEHHASETEGLAER